MTYSQASFIIQPGNGVWIKQMEKIVNLKIEKIFRDDGTHYFLATSDDVQGLVAQGSTVEEVVDIAEDLTKQIFQLPATYLRFHVTIETS